MVTREALARLGQVAHAAGAAILAAAAPPGRADLKSDRSPVTEADRAAHRAIVPALTAWYPEIPVVSEEGEIPPHDVRREWRRFWLVDPLDGTKEFLAENAEYTVNIALIEDEAPVMGVVYAPAIDLLYLAGRDLGSWKQAAGDRPRRIHSAPAPADGPLVVVESRSHPSAELEAFLATIHVKARVRAGSSLKFCWVAEGKADLYPRFGPTMEWDTAAGDCVYRCSGRGAMRTSPLRYNTPSLRHDAFVIGR